MQSAHDKFAKEQLKKATPLMVAKVKQQKIYVISYIDGNNFRKTISCTNCGEFFAIVELLNACGRKYSYQIMNESYVSLR